MNQPKKYQSDAIAAKLKIRHDHFCARVQKEFYQLDWVNVYHNQNGAAAAGRPVKILLLEQQYLFRLPLLFPRNEVAVELFDNLMAELFSSKEEISVPQSYGAALLEAGRLQIALEEKERQLAIAAPKIEAFELLMDSGQNISFEIFAGLVQKNGNKGSGRNTLMRKLREMKVLKTDGPAHNLPYQPYLEAGYFVVIENMKNGYLQKQTLITPKGQKWLVKLLGLVLSEAK